MATQKAVTSVLVALPQGRARLQSLRDLRRTFDAFREEAHRIVNFERCYVALFHPDGKQQITYLRRTGRLSKHTVLKRSAISFFNLISGVMQLHWSLKIGRITDPPVMRGRVNLCVPHINELLQACGRFTPAIGAASDGIERYGRLTRDVRNRAAAHLDKITTLSDKPIGGHKTSDVVAFFESLQSYNDLVGIAIGRGPMDLGYPETGDASELVKVLRAGLKALDDEKRARARP